MSGENEDQRKRRRSPSPPSLSTGDAQAGNKTRRVSRFGEKVLPADASAGGPMTAAAIKAQVEARAADIARKLQSATAGTTPTAAATAAENAKQQALLLQAQVAAQLASVSSILGKGSAGGTAASATGTATTTAEKKPVIRALRLDDKGREIDEHGNVVVNKVAPVKTLTANVQAERAAQRKKNNPYLAHTRQGDNPASDAGAGGASSASAAASAGATDEASAAVAVGLDPRLAVAARRREAHLKRALNFVEEGTFVKEQEKIVLKEERKVIAGYASGRKAPELLDRESAEGAHGDGDASPLLTTKAPLASIRQKECVAVPPPVDDGCVVPIMEWWDEAYLPRDQATTLKKQMLTVSTANHRAAVMKSGGGSEAVRALIADDSGVVAGSESGAAAMALQPRVAAINAPAAASSSSSSGAVSSTPAAALPHTTSEFWSLLALTNSKTYRYIQHPVAPKPLCGEKAPDAPLPVYLTTKERKRIRKQAREEREREKRDKIIMGLLPPAEAKLKLSNFMKVLGDQAVADPSKIEQKVIQQMRKRQLNHEMRNQARKLTPQERKEKEKKKNIEDTSKGVHVAVFKVGDLSDKKKQFKVDVTAAQYNLTGTVLLCTNPEVATNVVVVEGGPHGIKNFTKLMLRRIPWKKPSEAYTRSSASKHAIEEEEEDAMQGELAPGMEQIMEQTAAARKAKKAEEVDPNAPPIPGVTAPLIDPQLNECMLLWQGILPKRTYHLFKFQEFRTAPAARKALEGKGVEHYWDMAVSAVSGSGIGSGMDFADDDDDDF